MSAAAPVPMVGPDVADLVRRTGDLVRTKMTLRARVFEAAGRSLFGAMAINAAAPDEGNMHLLAHVATAAQREEFLAPLVRGEARSAFPMTEPAPGAGSDPAALASTATRVPGGWRIDGRKIFITGADGAAFFIIMARTRGEAGDRGGGTMFLARAGAPGLRVGRHVPTMDRSMVGGTARSGSTGWSSRRRRCSARWTRDSATPRCGWGRPG